MVQCIIFDCDGVLVDSETISASVSAEVKTALGFPISLAEQLKNFTGYGLNSPWVQAAMAKLPPEYKTLARQKLFAEFQQNLKPTTGTLNFIQNLKIDFCVASSSDVERIELALKVTGLLPFFQGKIFSSQMVARGKPFPDLFLYAAQQMGFTANQCLVVEDSEPGILAAQAAQMPVVGYVGASHMQPPLGLELMNKLKATGLTQFISNMQELAKWL